MVSEHFRCYALLCVPVEDGEISIRIGNPDERSASAPIIGCHLPERIGDRIHLMIPVVVTNCRPTVAIGARRQI